MKILHISDLHFSSKRNSIVDKMINAIKNENIDMCIFSGDILDKFRAEMDDAYKYLREKLLEAGVHSFYLTCGNHDIDRSVVSELFKNYVQSVGDLEWVDKFVNENKADDFIQNCRHINKYNKLIEENYPNSKRHELYSIHQTILDEKQIAIVSLNLAWTAFDTDSYGKLVYPLSVLKSINKSIQNADIKFLIIHFDINYLDVNFQAKFSKHIREMFDCIFIGHVHDEDTKELNYDENGVFISITPCLKSEISSHMRGFKILDIDVNLFEIEVCTYLMEGNEFVSRKSNRTIPANEEKKMQLRIFEAIQSKREQEIAKAKKMFALRNIQIKSVDEMFVNPILKSTSRHEIRTKEGKYKKEKDIDYRNLLNHENCIVFGNDKSGKSTLLHKVTIDLLEKYTKLNTIPLMIDFKYIYQQDIHELNLDDLLKEEYNFSNKQIESIGSTIQVRILIDNYILNKNCNESLFKSLTSSKYLQDISFLIMSNETLGAEFKTFDERKDFTKLFLHDISRKSIRELTNRYITNIEVDKNHVIERISNIFSQLGISVNFWTVSMFLYVVNNTSNVKLKNSAELIDLYIEKLLDKEGLVLNNSKFSYENYKAFLSEIAFLLYSQNTAGLYCVKYIDLLECYEKIKTENIRFVAKGKDVLDYLIQKDVLTEISDDCYTFRMNGVFEYFLAFYMYRNEDFKINVISNKTQYLAFKNELELYSGMRKSDELLLKEIFHLTKNVKNEIIKDPNYDLDFEQKICNENSNVKALMDIAAEIRNDISPMPSEQKDIIDDETDPLYNIEDDVKVKPNHSEYDYYDYMACVKILGRVFRNIDDIRDLQLQKDVFRFLVEECCFGVYTVIDQFVKDIQEEKLSEKETENFKEFITSFSPIIAQSMLFDIVAHPTLTNIILDEIKLFMKNSESHQFRLFVLYFMLIETELIENIDKIKELIDITKHWHIQNSIFLKLIILLITKCEAGSGLENKIRASMETIRKKMDPKSRFKADVNKTIESIHLAIR